MGFILSSNYEFTTLEKRWGKFNQVDSLAVYSQSGIKNVKCWGSSVSLYNVLKQKKGIYGLDTYAKSHTVAIYYDENEITEQGVKKLLFSPTRYETRTFNDYTPDSLTIWEIGINNLFDRVDQMNLVRALHQCKYIFGVETFFGEPVLARIYFDADSMDASEINAFIEVKKIETQIGNKKRVYEMNFACIGKGKISGRIDTISFRRLMFDRMDQRFNKYDELDKNQLHVYEIGLPNAGNIFMRRNMKFIVSHISVDDNIVRYRTTFTDRPVAQIYFHPGFVDTTKIHRLLTADTLNYFTSDTTTARTANIFKFQYPSRSFPISILNEATSKIQ